MRNLSTVFVAASILVASLVACGGSDNAPPNTPAPQPAVTASASPTASTPQPPSTAASAQPGDAGLPPPADTAAAGPKFADLPKDKKVEVMMTKVVPNVGKDFKDYDGKRYEKFGCATCHGPKKNQDPHEVLPVLTMSNGGFEKLQKNKPEITKFMMEKVTPDMAAAMGDKPFDPATHTGFGCGGCHKVK